jgi:sortase A
MSRGRRALLLAGLVAGLLAAADGVLTIVWQEPLTAIVQARSQSDLRDDLAARERAFARAEAQAAAEARRRRESRAAQARARAARQRREAMVALRAADGAALGTLEIPGIDLRTVVVASTSHDALTKGPGHYRGTALPGLRGTVGIAGHRTTYGAPFRRIDEVRPGARLVLRMPYGRFAYRVTGTRITTPGDASALQDQRGAPRLVLTACHPLYSAAKRIVVTARQVTPTPA